MTMNAFQILEPRTLEEAVLMYEAHAEQGCLYISGGTDVIPPIRKGVVKPDYLIDLRFLGLDRIRQTDTGAYIGAAVTMKSIYRSSYIKSQYPALAMAAESVGCVQTRGLATVGGNICVALPSADSAPPLYCYEAVMEIYAKEGVRHVPVSEFVTGPRKTCLRPGEILKGIYLPKQDKNTAAHFIKFGRRNALTLSIVNEAVCTVYDGEKFRNPRIAVGACGPTPMRILSAEKYLEGKSAGEVDEGILSELIGDGIKPISDFRASAEYRKILAGALVCKSLRCLTGRDIRGDIVLEGHI